MGNRMKYVLSVLHVCHDGEKKIIDRELGSIYDIRYSTSYDRQEQLHLAEDADFLWVGGSIVDAELIERASKLKVIHKSGIGVDKIDLEAARAKGIKVYITGGANAVPVSEMALMLMMAVLRRFVYADTSLRKGKWPKIELGGVTQHLSGKTVGILGMGNIGKNLAKLLKGFECRVLYYDVNRPTSEVERSLDISYTAIEELLKNSDVVSLNLPLTAKTKNMINAETFSIMKRTAIIVNTARGGIIDEKALIEALQTGTIAGAGLDVFAMEPADPNSPLFKMDNVVVSPHVAGSTLNTVPVRAKTIAKNLDAFLKGKEVTKTDIIVG
jgi:D-3-phosphoglycerate dehydrogenase